MNLNQSKKGYLGDVGERMQNGETMELPYNCKK